MSIDNRPWVEKYRPRSLDDVVNQTGILKRFRNPTKYQKRVDQNCNYVCLIK